MTFFWRFLLLLILVQILPSRFPLAHAQSIAGEARWQVQSHHASDKPSLQILEPQHRNLPAVEIGFKQAASWAISTVALRPQRKKMEGTQTLRLWLRAADEPSVGHRLEFSVKTVDNKRRWQYPTLSAQWTSVEVTLTPELIETIDGATLGLPQSSTSIKVLVSGPEFERADNMQSTSTETHESIVNLSRNHAKHPSVEQVDYDGWRSARIGGGGWIQGVVPCPSDPSRFYAYVDIGGLYRSDDGGKTWRMLHHRLPHGHVRSVSVHPDNADDLLVAMGKRTWGQGVYRSVDGGMNWQRTLEAEFHGNDTPPARAAGVVLARHLNRSNIILAASRNQGVFRSHDRGATWINVGVTGQIPQHIIFDRENPDRLWLCTMTDRKWHKEGGLFRSIDAGLNWQKIAEQSPSELVPHPRKPDVLFGLFNESTVMRSEDAGVTWTAFTQGLPIDPDAARREPVNEHRFLTLAAGPDFVLTASTRGTIYRLDVGSDRWQRVERKSVEQGDWPLAVNRLRHGEFNYLGASLSSITVSPHDPQHWFWTDWFGLYQSRDAGQHWSLSVDGIECTVVHDLVVDPRDTQLIHAGLADIGYLRSTDGGMSFFRGRTPVGSGMNIRLIAAPQQGNQLYAVGSRGSHWTSDQLFVSDDRGQTWRYAAMRGYPTGKSRCSAVAVHPFEADQVLLIASGEVGSELGGVYRSQDGGESFRWWGEGLPAGQKLFTSEIWGGGRHLAIDRDGTVFAVATEQKQLYVRRATEDRWTPLNIGQAGPPVSVWALSDAGNFLLQLHESGLLRTRDAGQHWQTLTHGRLVGVGVNPSGERLAVLVHQEATRWSKDAGITWQSLDDAANQLPLGHALGIGPDFRLIAGSDGNGIFWKPLPPNIAP